MRGDSTNTELGTSVLTLARTMHQWVPRRQETVEYLNHAVSRRTVRVEIDPTLIWRVPTEEAGPTWRGRFLVPVAMLERSGHTSIEVVDESGSRLPRLTQSEERHIIRAGIIELARTALKVPRLEDEVEAELKHLVDHKHSEAVDLDGLRKSEQGQKLILDAEFCSTLRSAATFYTLLVPINPVGPGRRALTYSYLEDIGKQREPSSDPAAPASRKAFRDRAWFGRYYPLRTFDYAMHTMGTYGVRIYAPSVRYCGSYHLEVPSPYDLVIEGGCLNVTGVDDLEPVSHRDNDRLETHSHVHVEYAGPVSASSYTATFRLMPTSLVRSAPLSCAFVTLSLLATLLYMVWNDDWSFRMVDTNSAVSLLLLVPGAVATVLASPSSHSLTTKLLFPTRLMLWFTGTCSFAGAMAIAVGLSGWPALFYWSIIIFLSNFCLFMLGRQQDRLTLPRDAP